MNQVAPVVVIGAGLAGTEAAFQIASAGLPVRLVEMRPIRRSPAHHSSEFAELVCSNSFGALSSDRAAGLLQVGWRRQSDLEAIGLELTGQRLNLSWQLTLLVLGSSPRQCQCLRQQQQHRQQQRNVTHRRWFLRSPQQNTARTASPGHTLHDPHRSTGF